MSFDEFEAECGDRLRSIGHYNVQLVYGAAIKAAIPPEKAVDALVDGYLQKRDLPRPRLPSQIQTAALPPDGFDSSPEQRLSERNIEIDLNRSFLEDLRAHFGTIALEDIGLFKWGVFLEELGRNVRNTQTQIPQT